MKSPTTFINNKFLIANKNYHLNILKCCVIIFKVFVFIIEYTTSFWFWNSNTIILTTTTWMRDAQCNDYHFIVHFRIAEKVSTTLGAFGNTLPCPHTVACIFKSCYKHNLLIGPKKYIQRDQIQRQQIFNQHNHH